MPKWHQLRPQKSKNHKKMAPPSRKSMTKKLKRLKPSNSLGRDSRRPKTNQRLRKKKAMKKRKKKT